MANYLANFSRNLWLKLPIIIAKSLQQKFCIKTGLFPEIHKNLRIQSSLSSPLNTWYIIDTRRGSLWAMIYEIYFRSAGWELILHDHCHQIIILLHLLYIIIVIITSGWLGRQGTCQGRAAHWVGQQGQVREPGICGQVWKCEHFDI